MQFIAKGYFFDFNYSLVNQQLTVEGFCHNKYCFFKFSPGNSVVFKKYYQSYTATVIKFTEKFAYLSCGGKEKRVPLQTFIDENKFTEIVFRVEKEGFGPYRSPEPSQTLLAWREQMRELFKVQEDRLPCPQQDSGLSNYSLLPYSCKFAFKSYEQLFNWFTLEDMRFLAREGFKIEVKQKGRDYFDSFSGRAQVAYSETEESYKQALYSPSYY